MNGKPVLWRPARTVLNLINEAFATKRLCDGITMNLGDACTFSCRYCYVGPQVRKFVFGTLGENRHEDVVVRRQNALDLLRAQLTTRDGQPKFQDPEDRRIVYSSTTVDVAGNLELAEESAEACRLILDLTHWQIRLLSKSNLLPHLVRLIPEKWHSRLILGFSTGTLDDTISRVIEPGTALVSKRIKALHRLQDNGFRTFGMICPSLPQTDYSSFARTMAEAVRIDKCEHVWAEVINVRGGSFKNTYQALIEAGKYSEAELLASVSSQEGDGVSERHQKKEAWESYARTTFLAHTKHIPASKLRFLQYVNPNSFSWWQDRTRQGAVVL